MRKFCGIVLIIIGFMMIYFLPEMIISLWPQETQEINTASTLLMAMIVSLPIIIAFGAGLILLIPKSK